MGQVTAVAVKECHLWARFRQIRPTTRRHSLQALLACPREASGAAPKSCRVLLRCPREAKDMFVLWNMQHRALAESELRRSSPILLPNGAPRARIGRTSQTPEFAETPSESEIFERTHTRGVAKVPSFLLPPPCWIRPGSRLGKGSPQARRRHRRPSGPLGLPPRDARSLPRHELSGRPRPSACPLALAPRHRLCRPLLGPPRHGRRQYHDRGA